MGFFRNNAEPTHREPKASRFGRRSGEKHGRHVEQYTMGKRPTFGQWLKHTWLDLMTMVIMGAVGLGVYFAKPAPSRSFPVTFSDGEIVWPEYGYPMRGEIIPIWLAALLASLVPIFIVLCMQIRVRSFWDVNNAVMGILYSLITAAVFQVFVKWLIGGFRPHFLTVCKPDISLSDGSGYDAKGFTGIYYTRDICTGDDKEINDALESMPSGHTTAAFAGFIYLYLYLNAKLKVFSNYHPSMWKLVATYAPVLGAVLIGGALTIDKYHHWYDVAAGAIIGTVMAFSSYRMTYAAVWDWRFNHIPLHRGIAFNYVVGEGDLYDAVFTRKAGWGTILGAAAGHAMKGAHHGAHHHGAHTGVHGGTHHNGVHPDGPYHNHGDPAMPRRPVGATRGAEDIV